jgi:hypothetical protein
MFKRQKLNFNINNNYIKMSERRSFAEILKENLTEKSFKNGVPPKLKPKPLSYQILDPFRKEIYDYFINLKDLLKIHSSRTFYAKLFKNPVKISFYWCEEDWQGSIFAIYEYSGKFISVNGGFGSCSGCDFFIRDSEELHEHSQERLDKIFSHLTINENINDINIHGNHPEYTHPELINKFNIWKEGFAPRRQEVEEKVKVENVFEETVETKEIKEEKIENVVKEVPKKTWADIVSKKK